MRALLHDPDAPHGLRLGEAPEPEPGPARRSSRSTRSRSTSARSRSSPTRQRPARCRAGTPPGRCSPRRPTAAARRRARASPRSAGPAGGRSGAPPTPAELAVLPDAVDVRSGRGVPVAGVTALRAVRAARAGDGPPGADHRRVGRRRALRRPARRARRRPRRRRGGARSRRAWPSSAPPRWCVERRRRGRAGGRRARHTSAATAGRRVRAAAPGGVALSVGHGVAGADDDRLRGRARCARAARRIEAFGVGRGRFGADLAYLLALLADGELDPQIGWRGRWERVDEAAAALSAGGCRGKAVLEVTP